MPWFESITPTEFEKLCTKKLEEIAAEKQLPDFQITHNEIVHASDGNYQIDIRATFSALNVLIIIFCECKCYKAKVQRDVVMLLDQKLKSCGANKGIVMAVNGFQSGAIEYAKQHGIALLNIEPVPGCNPSPQGISLNRKCAADIDSDQSSQNVIRYLSSRVKINTVTALFTKKDESIFRLDKFSGEVKTRNKIEIELG